MTQQQILFSQVVLVMKKQMAHVTQYMGVDKGKEGLVKTLSIQCLKYIRVG